MLAALMQQEHVGVGVCDREGLLTMMSPALELVLGAAASSTTQMAWSAHYHLYDEDGELLPPGEDPLARALRGDDVADCIISIRRPDEPIRWALTSGFQLHDDHSGELIGAAVFVLDLTIRAEAQRQLDELRDRLVETVNHEVRTPLATMTGHLEVLEDRIPALPGPVQWSLAAMTRAAARLGEVVATISDLAEQSQRRQETLAPKQGPDAYPTRSVERSGLAGSASPPPRTPSPSTDPPST